MAQGDLALAAGGDDPVVFGHGAGAIRVHIAGFSKARCRFSDHKGMDQLPVFEDFPEIEAVFGQHRPGLRPPTPRRAKRC